MFFERLPEFIGNNPILVAAFVGVTLAIIYTEAARLARGFKALGPAQLTALINYDDAVVVDVSGLVDYEKGHITGARHVPMSQFDPESKQLARLREAPVALVCRNGVVSSGAAKRLVKAGFTKVHWLEGGVAAWQAAEMPVARGREKKREGGERQARLDKPKSKAKGSGNTDSRADAKPDTNPDTNPDASHN